MSKESEAMATDRLANIFTNAMRKTIEDINPKTDESFIKDIQLSARGKWGEWLLDHARDQWKTYDHKGDDTILYELDAETLDHLAAVSQKTEWFSIIEPRVSIFDIIKELNRANADLYIDYTAYINGEYLKIGHETVSETAHLEFGTDRAFYGDNIGREIRSQLQFLNSFIMNVSRYERESIMDFLARHIIGTLMYLGDAAAVIRDKGLDNSGKLEAELHNLSTTIANKGRYARCNPERSVSIEVSDVKIFYIDKPDGKKYSTASLDALTACSEDRNFIGIKRVDCRNLAELNNGGLRTAVTKKFLEDDHAGLGYTNKLYITPEDANKIFKSKSKSQRALDKLTRDVDMTPLSPEVAKEATEIAMRAIANTMNPSNEKREPTKYDLMKEAFARAATEGTREAFERELLPFLKKKDDTKSKVPENLENALNPPISAEKEFFTKIPEIAWYGTDGSYELHSDTLGDYCIWYRRYGEYGMSLHDNNPNFVIVGKRKHTTDDKLPEIAQILTFTSEKDTVINQAVLDVAATEATANGFNSVRGFIDQPGTWTRAYAFVFATMIRTLIKDNGSEDYSIPLKYAMKVASFCESIIEAATSMCSII